jgi:hypothetical protein
VQCGNFSRLHHVQTGSGAHPASYPMGIRWSFPGGKAAGSWSWLLTSFQYRGQECVALYLHPQYVCMAWCLVKHRDKFIFMRKVKNNFPAVPWQNSKGLKVFKKKKRTHEIYSEFCEMMATPSVHKGRESWRSQQRDHVRIQEAKSKFHDLLFDLWIEQETKTSGNI